VIVIVALEARYQRTPDGAVWSDGASDARFWQRYLDVFDGVHVVARVAPVAAAPAHGQRADAPGITWAPLPYFVGPWQFLRCYSSLRRALRTAVTPDAAIVLRVPGTLGTFVHRIVQATGQPYGVEVIGNPHDVFRPGGVRSILRPMMRWWYPRNLRRQCAGACAAAYVTAEILQQHYPPAPDAFVTHYSSIELADEAYVRAPPAIRPAGVPQRVVLVGSLEQLYKGPDVLIEALTLSIAAGHDLHATIVGDGKHRDELQALARARQVAERIRFTGRLPAGDAVRAELDRADVFVQPSRTEGLPRALIEAMARGLPCLGSAVGGIPELLDTAELVPPGNAAALACELQALLADPIRRARLAERNLHKARAYHADTLRGRRRAFYAAVRNAAARWQGKRGAVTPG
jgi:glycosyltransferase involved in cell wall biosynthesis